MRARRSPARVVMAVAVAGVALLGTSACASSPYQFVANDDRDVVLKVPSSWNQVSTKSVLNSEGTDTSSLGWVVFYDGADRPSTAHVQAPVAQQPVMIARSIELDKTVAASLTADELRDLFEPVSDSGRAADGQQRAAQGLPPRPFELISDQVVKTRTEQGVHVVYAYQDDGGIQYYDQIAVTDPKRTKVHAVMVRCSKTCFSAHQKQIESAVDSLTVKKP